MNIEEIQYMGLALQEILNSDKQTRDNGEEKLKNIKLTEPNKYACYLVSILQSKN